MLDPLLTAAPVRIPVAVVDEVAVALPAVLVPVKLE
jgi:hypothetical protein